MAPPRPICQRSTATAVSHLIMQSPPDTHRRLRRAGVESPRPMPTQFRRTSWLGCSPQPMHRLQATARCRKHDTTPSPRSPSRSPKAPPVALHLFWPLKSPPRPYPAAGLGWVDESSHSRARFERAALEGRRGTALCGHHRFARAAAVARARSPPGPHAPAVGIPRR